MFGHRTDVRFVRYYDVPFIGGIEPKEMNNRTVVLTTRIKDLLPSIRASSMSRRLALAFHVARCAQDTLPVHRVTGKDQICSRHLKLNGELDFSLKSEALHPNCLGSRFNRVVVSCISPRQPCVRNE